MQSRTFRRNVSVTLVAGALQGCSAFGPTAVQIPEPADIASFSQKIATLNTISGPDLVNLGYAISDYQCDSFFSALQAARNRNSFDAAELAAITATVVPAMTALKAGAKAIGITGGVLGLSTATVANYGEYALLLQYNTVLQDLVHDAQASYQAKIARDNPNPNALTVVQAYDIVGGYASLCTLSGIDSLARKALATAKTTTAGGAAPTPVQVGVIVTASQLLNLPPGDQLTFDKAAALLVFRSNPSAKTSDNIRDRLNPAEIKAIFQSDSGRGTVLSPKNQSFYNAMFVLGLLQTPGSALDAAVQEQTKALAAGTPPPPTAPPIGAAPVRPSLMPIPETVLPAPSLGVSRPKIEIVR
jgi:hypothetical protein